MENTPPHPNPKIERFAEAGILPRGAKSLLRQISSSEGGSFGNVDGARASFKLFFASPTECTRHVHYLGRTNCSATWITMVRHPVDWIASRFRFAKPTCFLSRGNLPIQDTIDDLLLPHDATLSCCPPGL